MISIERHADTDGTGALETLTTEEFLRVVGQRVRQHRTRVKMSRKRLAQVSGVSERYLAQLESGQGNMSIALLRKVAHALGMKLGVLMSDLDDVRRGEAPTLASSPVVMEAG